MKLKLLYVVIAIATLSYSCSTDGDDNEINEDSISNLVGVWNLTTVNFTGQDASELNLAAEIVDNLADEGCYLVSLDFNEDSSVIGTYKTDFIEINAGPTGLDVPCPTESLTETSVWSLDGNQLTFINEDLEEETIEISLDGNTLILAGEAIDADNYSGAEAVFMKN